MTVAIYKYNGTEFPIEIKVGKAIDWKHKFGINLLNLFEEENLEAFAQLMSLNDEKMIEVWWEVVSTKFSDREKQIDELTRDDLTAFKEALWAAIVNFSDRDAKPVLLEFKKQLPGLIKQNILSNLTRASQESSLPNESS